MAATLQLSRERIFAIYTRKRQSGESMERVISQLQTVAQELPREDRHQLNRDVVEWEAQFEVEKVVRNDSPALEQATPAQRTSTTSTLQSAPNRQTGQIAQITYAPQSAPQPTYAQTEAPKLFPTRLLDPSKLAALGLSGTAQTSPVSPVPQSAPLPSPTVVSIAPRPQTQRLVQSDLPVNCSQCGWRNVPGETRCNGCGNVLNTRRVGTQPIDKDNVRSYGKTAQFINHARIFLRVRGYAEALQVDINDKVVLGCTIADSSTKPNIDLTPFSAVRLGVSRHHVALRRENGTITVTDLESSNFTYLNGHRLYPHEVRVLRHDDEVRLGNLSMKVLFRL